MSISFPAPKTSAPDWMTLECECLLPMCPVCDCDFYIDQMREEAHIWGDAFDLEPPF